MASGTLFCNGFAKWFFRCARSRLAVVMLAGLALYGCKDKSKAAPGDETSPTVTISANKTDVTRVFILKLTAEASDDVGVTKVVFAQDGQVLGEDAEAPYAFQVNLTSAENGEHKYTATAFDAAGNQASAEVAVLVNIRDRFFGTAPHSDADYEYLLAHFNQITPANAGKWGSVEGTKDTMVWTDLDKAYNFAKDNGLLFKFHTLVWGQQQPGWICALSTKDQLAQITEWMDAVAERYPDIDMIDVVNESLPQHAPPCYKEALGGDNGLYGTGWDWVIRAFEMARDRFPNAKLLLNDYDIVVLEQFTQQYLEVIKALQDHPGLIDGIGEQAHSLEYADLAVIEADLDALAATGLPIYISELELNIENDNQQANRMRDLFSLFWEHPAVAGVTHWGYLQGSMWDRKPYAYLVSAEGSSRPALDWLDCYIAGNDDCALEPYVLPPKEGGDFSINLPAIEFDGVKGLIASGSVIAYTDDGDWVKYSSVVFRDTYNTFRIRYAKGNDAVGSLTVHLDSLDNPAVATMTVTTTGSWDTFSTIEVPLDFSSGSIAGQHDVYLQFHEGSGGVANVQTITFGTPLRRVGATEALDIVADSYDAQQGITDTNPNDGVITAGDAGSYVVYSSVWVGTYREFSAVYSSTVDGVVEVHVGSPTGALVATLATPSTATEATTKLELPEGVYDLYVVFTVGNMGNFSRFSLLEGEPGGNLVSNSGFEVVGTSGWSSWGGTLQDTTDRAHGGSHSLLVTNRTGTGNNALYPLTSLVAPGQSYAVSAWVTIGGVASAPVNITAKIACAGEADQYPWLANSGAVNDGTWVELAGTLTVPSCTLTELLFYVEGPDKGIDLYVDDVVITP